MTRQGGANPLESPDGTTLYYTRSPSGPSPLYRMPVEGGDETKVLDSVEGRAFAVTPKGIYFLSQGRLQYYDFAAAATTTIRMVEKADQWWLSVSPDEHWLLYTQVDQGGSDLMRVDNFH